MKKERYIVCNAYGISGESRHRSPERAVEALNKREGLGWQIIRESDGMRMIVGFDRCLHEEDGLDYCDPE